MVKSKTPKDTIILFWLRRDLRLEDNVGLARALSMGFKVQLLFIFDSFILNRLQDKDDARVTFLHQRLDLLKTELREHGADLWVRFGTVLNVFEQICSENHVHAVLTNHDYEPSALRRDAEVKKYLETKGILFESSKDQVVFEKSEILSGQGTPYTVFTPYKKKWLEKIHQNPLETAPFDVHSLHKTSSEPLISLSQIGFIESSIRFPSTKIHPSVVQNYDKTRDIPSLDAGTTHLGLHFRFGTISPRKAVRAAFKLNDTWLSELIWREFFMQILFHFPHVVDSSFRKEYDKIAWRDSDEDFSKWCQGLTGYPLVDAGMRELNATGYMHNRVRMVVASFLCKHLLIYWHRGERYFARKLLDYDLSANNGNWQWAAGTGCDAAPYFRIFNPASQLKKFDPDFKYVKKWVPEFGTSNYPEPMVVHEKARERALRMYKQGLGKG
jgi:deoxyribodipyrimidine photo-lyase